MASPVTSTQLLTRLEQSLKRTGEPDWSVLGPDFEIHDHELPDSAVHRGRDGWRRWTSDWEEAFEDYSLERMDRIEVDESRILTVHRLRARGRASGVQLERTDAQLWTFSGGLLVRMDYYPNYRGSSELEQTDGAR